MSTVQMSPRSKHWKNCAIIFNLNNHQITINQFPLYSFCDYFVSIFSSNERRQFDPFLIQNMVIIEKSHSVLLLCQTTKQIGIASFQLKLCLVCIHTTKKPQQHANVVWNLFGKWWMVSYSKTDCLVSSRCYCLWCDQHVEIKFGFCVSEKFMRPFQ